jgi:hypothetical protein
VRLSTKDERRDLGSFAVDGEVALGGKANRVGLLEHGLRLTTCDEHRGTGARFEHAAEFVQRADHGCIGGDVIGRLGRYAIEPAISKRKGARVPHHMLIGELRQSMTQARIDVHAGYGPPTVPGGFDDASSAGERIEEEPRGGALHQVHKEARIMHRQRSALQRPGSTTVPNDPAHHRVAAFEKKGPAGWAALLEPVSVPSVDLADRIELAAPSHLQITRARVVSVEEHMSTRGIPQPRKPVDRFGQSRPRHLNPCDAGTVRHRTAFDRLSMQVPKERACLSRRRLASASAGWPETQHDNGGRRGRRPRTPDCRHAVNLLGACPRLMYRRIIPTSERLLPLRMLYQPLGDGAYHRACEAASFRGLVAALLDDPDYERVGVEDRLMARLRLADEVRLLAEVDGRILAVADRDAPDTINVASDEPIIRCLDRLGMISLEPGR